MDEQLKARLIGAVVLVAIAVLLIPELLSGRKAEEPAAAATAGTTAHGTRTYTIDLSGGATASQATEPGSQPAPAVTALPVPPQPQPQPQAQAATAAEDTDPSPPDKVGPAATPQPAAKAPAAVSPTSPPAAKAAAPPAPAPAATAASGAKPAPAPSKGGMAVQVGAFSTAAAANKLIGQLKGAGFSAYPAPISKSGKTLHRVRVGPVGSRAEADQLAAKLKARGLPATVVTND
jgi:cell division septation protein DedD